MKIKTSDSCSWGVGREGWLWVHHFSQSWWRITTGLFRLFISLATNKQGRLSNLLVLLQGREAGCGAARQSKAIPSKPGSRQVTSHLGKEPNFLNDPIAKVELKLQVQLIKLCTFRLEPWAIEVGKSGNPGQSQWKSQNIQGSFIQGNALPGS